MYPKKEKKALLVFEATFFSNFLYLCVRATISLLFHPK